MRASGLLDEVAGLLAAGFGPESPGMTGTGYREIAAHLRGEMTLDEALEAMKTQTRQYARRQITWFRHQLTAPATPIDASLPLDEQVSLVERGWAEKVAA